MRIFLSFILFFLVGCSQPLTQNKTIKINTRGKVENGIVVSISSIELPKKDNGPFVIFASIENIENTSLDGIILGGHRFLIELDGLFYAEDDFGGKSSPMPLGKTYTQIGIGTNYFRKIKSKKEYYRYDKNAANIELTPGKHKIRVFYKINAQKEYLVPSQEVEIICF
ncbi:MAG: hypothetical protein A2231_02640 [Candidatus Firestonebacteria bacterium RIFOXYA2_FULL_40_8]|nr:MAG: hypothetical protein A2231_02640 [Candidatus Firestonebacteria bacterium RIFOXYA2_FULL_40_8]